MTGIVVVTGHFPEYLGAYPLELGLVKCRVLQDVGQQCKAQFHILLQHADRGGREIFGSLDFQGAADKVDLLGELFRRPGGRAFVKETGDQIRKTGFVGGILRRPALDHRMDFDNRQEMLLQHEDRHAVGRHEFRGNNLGCRERGRGNGNCERAEQEPSGSRMVHHRAKQRGDHGFPCTAAVGDSGGLGMTGIKVPTVRASSSRYCDATRCTSFAVTAWILSKN